MAVSAAARWVSDLEAGVRFRTFALGQEEAGPENLCSIDRDAYWFLPDGLRI